MKKKTAKKPAPAKGKKAKKVVKPVKAWTYIEDGELVVWDIRQCRPTTAWNIPVLIVPDDGTYTVTPTRAGRGSK